MRDYFAKELSAPVDPAAFAISDDMVALLSNCPASRVTNRQPLAASRQRGDDENKHERAIELRDLALSVVKARGAWMKTKPGWPNVLAFDSGDLRIAYRSPFQKMPPPSGELIRTSMAHGLMPPEASPYGLGDLGAARCWNILSVRWRRGCPQLQGRIMGARVGNARGVAVMTTAASPRRARQTERACAAGVPIKKPNWRRVSAPGFNNRDDR